MALFATRLISFAISSASLPVILILYSTCAPVENPEDGSQISVPYRHLSAPLIASTTFGRFAAISEVMVVQETSVGQLGLRAARSISPIEIHVLSFNIRPSDWLIKAALLVDDD